jgi:hypothetical protein
MPYVMDTQPLLDLLLWNGPSTAANVLRTLRTSDRPDAHFAEMLNWDYGYLDPTWPGFSEYLQGKNYDVSKVNTNIWDPTQGREVILDSELEDNEECGSTGYPLCRVYSVTVGEECRVVGPNPKLWSSSSSCPFGHEMQVADLPCPRLAFTSMHCRIRRDT